VDNGWATARTLRIVANNRFGRQCSDMSPTFTARTRNREKVSASRSCIEFDLCDTAASAIIQGRAHKLLANSSAAMFLRDEHHADPGQILAVCDRGNSANPFAGARCGETRVDQVSKVASNHSRSGSLFPFFELQCLLRLFAESLLQPCQHGLDSASSAIRFINCSGTFIRTSLLVRDDPSHPAVAQNNDGLSLLYTGLRLRHDRESSPHATGNSRPHA